MDNPLRTWISLLLVTSCVSIPVAHAVLGEPADTVENDRKNHEALKSKVSKSRTGYQVHELSGPHQTIREYEADGIIFAIAWDGERHPDLTKLLGKYTPEFQDLSQKTPRSRGRRFSGQLRGTSLIVERSGHMRSMRGRAYDLKLLPKGISLDEIK